MKGQKGQVIVEFAVVLPFFLMLAFLVIHSGLLFADYMNLSNVARSSAREAALQGTAAYADIREHYRTNTHLISNLYTWDEGDNGFQFAEGDVSNSVQVRITTTLNEEFPGVRALDWFGLRLPRTYEIQYSMHDETAGT